MKLPKRVLVISDLHLGIGDVMSMFTAGAALARFIDWAAGEAGDVELVILGDGLDYLQVEPWIEFTEATAVTKTEAMIAANPGVFTALAAFCATPGKSLVWSIGNHDLEILFKAVRDTLEKRLGESITWRLDEKPRDYVLPGGAIVRLVHGNGPDPFNDVNYANVAAVVDGGGKPDEVYPHGSHMVATIFNPLKKQGYRFVDLLKPEESVALPLTLALWPDDAIERLKQGFPSFARGLREGFVRKLFRWVRGNKPVYGPGEVPPDPPTTVEEQAFAEVVRDLNAANISEKQLLEWLANPEGAVQPQPNGTFGAGSTIAAALLRAAALRNAAVDPFDPFGPDGISDASRNVGKDGVVLLVAGHTHLARVHEREGSWYINSGTWADLMRLPPNLTRTQVGQDVADIREHLTHPATAPAWLRPFRRLTFVDINFPGGDAWAARLQQWPEAKALTIAEVNVRG